MTKGSPQRSLKARAQGAILGAEGKKKRQGACTHLVSRLHTRNMDDALTCWARHASGCTTILLRSRNYPSLASLIHVAENDEW